MTWPVPTPYPEAINWFRGRLPVTDAEFRSLSNAARRRAFTVAGVSQLDLATDVWRQIDRAVDQGIPLDEFRSQVGGKLEAAWGDDERRPGWRHENIYRTNVQSAYAAGRYRQQMNPAVAGARPWWLYDSVLDSRTSTICNNLNGTLLRNDDPSWDEIYPPNHFGGCRSAVRSLTERQAQRRIEADAEREVPRLKLERPPQEPDQAFASAPSLDDWVPRVEKYPPELAKIFQRSFVTSPLFASFVAGGPAPSVLPVAVVTSPQLAAAMGAQTVMLPRVVIEAAEVAEDLYREVQPLIEGAELVTRRGDLFTAYAREGDRLVAIEIDAGGELPEVRSMRYADEDELATARREGDDVRE